MPNTIKVKRGKSAALNSSTEKLQAGEVLYNLDKNYLTVGAEDNDALTKKPVAAREIVGYTGDTDSKIGTSTTEAYSIRYNDDSGVVISSENNILSTPGTVKMQTPGKNASTITIRTGEVSPDGSANPTIELSNNLGAPVTLTLPWTTATLATTDDITTSIATKLDNTKEDKVALKNNKSLRYTSNAAASTIMSRDANGRAKVADGAADQDIATVGQLNTGLNTKVTRPANPTADSVLSILKDGSIGSIPQIKYITLTGTSGTLTADQLSTLNENIKYNFIIKETRQAGGYVQSKIFRPIQVYNEIDEDVDFAYAHIDLDISETIGIAGNSWYYSSWKLSKDKVVEISSVDADSGTLTTQQNNDLLDRRTLLLLHGEYYYFIGDLTHAETKIFHSYVSYGKGANDSLQIKIVTIDVNTSPNTWVKTTYDLGNYYTKLESDNKYSQATNLKNGAGTNSLVTYNSNAAYPNSVCFGDSNVANGSFQVLFGRFSAPKSSTSFAIGNGSSTSSRTNIFEVSNTGRVSFLGEPIDDTNGVRLLELNNRLYSIHKVFYNPADILTPSNVGNYYVFHTDVTTDSSYWIEPNNVIIKSGDIVKVIQITDSHTGNPAYFFKIVGIRDRELYLTNGQGKCSIVKKAYGTDVTPKAIGYYSNVFSVDTDKNFGGQAVAKYTTLFGINVRADSNAEGSIAGGRYVIIDSPYTLGYGRNITTQANNETDSKAVFGYNNKFNTKAILEVGNGTDTVKSNAFEVLKDGRAKVQTAPIEETDVIRLKELGNYYTGTESDGRYVKQTTGHNKVYATDSTGTDSELGYSQSPANSTITQYSSSGTLKTNTPTADLDAVNKKYGEDNYYNLHVINFTGDTADLNTLTTVGNYGFGPSTSVHNGPDGYTGGEPAKFIVEGLYSSFIIKQTLISNSREKSIIYTRTGNKENMDQYPWIQMADMNDIDNKKVFSVTIYEAGE